MPDHVHIAIRLLPRHSVSKVLQSIKGSSSKWINDNKKAEKHFSWQVGFGAFSVSKSRLSYLIDYIQNQENHHRQRDFKKEFVALLNKHGVEYDEKYL